MVMLMKSKNINIKNYINKAQKDSAPLLHKLYNKSAKIEIPTAQELMMERIQLDKWFLYEFENGCEDDPPFDDEILEYCELLGIKYEDVKPLDY